MFGKQENEIRCSWGGANEEPRWGVPKDVRGVGPRLARSRDVVDQEGSGFVDFTVQRSSFIRRNSSLTEAAYSRSMMNFQLATEMPFAASRASWCDFGSPVALVNPTVWFPSPVPHGMAKTGWSAGSS